MPAAIAGRSTDAGFGDRVHKDRTSRIGDVPDVYRIGARACGPIHVAQNDAYIVAAGPNKRICRACQRHATEERSPSWIVQRYFNDVHEVPECVLACAVETHAAASATRVIAIDNQGASIGAGGRDRMRAAWQLESG